jgi:hypothetical protein
MPPQLRQAAKRRNYERPLFEELPCLDARPQKTNPKKLVNAPLT